MRATELLITLFTLNIIHRRSSAPLKQPDHSTIQLGLVIATREDDPTCGQRAGTCRVLMTCRLTVIDM
ncbi:hypothetical protein SCLCIDRAFT_1219332 [Scleroderma citrinum Foug A]|uniref:Uncharacterized protein n=1 Tax=Scleroderma citrinum Foug A TaxID=1036808 RepID=A0A0C2Z6M9_9AGAM|nr:hypothetical protein SCLCIDRAFT_1219332 [Scleroderma citrinum Foug A]